MRSNNRDKSVQHGVASTERGLLDTQMLIDQMFTVTTYESLVTQLLHENPMFM